MGRPETSQTSQDVVVVHGLSSLWEKKNNHLPSPISHLPSPISHLPSPISHLPSPISHDTIYFSSWTFIDVSKPPLFHPLTRCCTIPTHRIPSLTERWNKGEYLTLRTIVTCPALDTNRPGSVCPDEFFSFVFFRQSRSAVRLDEMDLSLIKASLDVPAEAAPGKISEYSRL